MHSDVHPFGPLNRVAFLGNYMPRKCGIATFTSDLCEGFRAAHPDIDTFALAINDRPEGYPYPPEVRFEIEEQDHGCYQRAADFLNISETDLVCIQHEYGIFGGPDGSHILAFLRDLSIPSVATLHTVLEHPTPGQKRILVEMSKLCGKLVVMTQKGKSLLKQVYGIADERIEIIHHGIPDIDPTLSKEYKRRIGAEGKRVLLSFGLLSPGKGLENILNALPAILEKHPDVLYVLLGATHPNLVREQGEIYRLGLERQARKNNVANHVAFYNRFVEINELREFIGACDIYVTPYLNRGQITSGTLAYSYGSGKVVISTPYWHAEELLADGRGFLVPFNDSEAIAKAVNHVLDSPDLAAEIRNKAYLEGREMLWPAVSRRYYDCFQVARKEFGRRISTTFATKRLGNTLGSLPRIDLSHVYRMADSTGMLQHAKYTIPNFNEGYCTDDNARLLILGTRIRNLGTGGPELDRVISVAASFLHHAFHVDTGRFRNFMSYDRRWLEDIGSEDSHGRAIWALGTVVGNSRDPGLVQICMHLFGKSIQAVESFTSLRAWAFSLIGIHEYFRRYHGDSLAHHLRTTLTDRIVLHFTENAQEDWPWPEDILSYANAKLPHALILAGRWTEQPEILRLGLRSLDWLWKLQVHESGHFRPIGCHGWLQRSGEPNFYDQQPIEAGTTVSACIEAYHATGDNLWFERATLAFQWFLGKNDLGKPLHDFSSGGCCDALQVDKINLNQGAESTLAYLLALTEITETHHTKKSFEAVKDVEAIP